MWLGVIASVKQRMDHVGVNEVVEMVMRWVRYKPIQTLSSAVALLRRGVGPSHARKS